MYNMKRKGNHCSIHAHSVCVYMFVQLKDSVTQVYTGVNHFVIKSSLSLPSLSLLSPFFLSFSLSFSPFLSLFLSLPLSLSLSLLSSLSLSLFLSLSLSLSPFLSLSLSLSLYFLIFVLL